MAYGQNGEPLRPAHGFPMRLIMPGFEGNLNIKWLRRLKFGDRPWMTRWETARYTQLRANGKATQFQLRMETNSVITSPSGTMVIKPGYQRISGTGLERSRQDRQGRDLHRRRQELGSKRSSICRCCRRRKRAFRWIGAGTASRPRSSAARPTTRAMSSPTGNPSSPRWGPTQLFHYNAQQTWSIDETGRVPKCPRLAKHYLRRCDCARARARFSGTCI